MLKYNPSTFDDKKTILQQVLALRKDYQGAIDGVVNIPIEQGDGANSVVLKNNEAVAAADYSIALGHASEATNDYAVAIGRESKAEGIGSVSEGLATEALGDYSHAEGVQTTAIDMGAHAEGFDNDAGCRAYKVTAIVSIDDTSAVLQLNTVTGLSVNNAVSLYLDKGYSAQLGKISAISGTQVTVTGFPATMKLAPNPDTTYIKYNYLVNKSSQNLGDLEIGLGSHAEGFATKSYSSYAHAEGYNTKAVHIGAHAEGAGTEAGLYAHAEGYGTKAYGQYSHAEGFQATAIGQGAHAEGNGTQAKGAYSHAEGNGCIADSDYAHASGYLAKARGYISYAHGYNADASASYSFAHGHTAQASQAYAVAIGQDVKALHANSAAFGTGTRTTNNTQMVVGKYNRNPNEPNCYFMVGCGANASTPDNAFEAGVTASNEKYIQIGQTELTEMDLRRLLALLV